MKTHKHRSTVPPLAALAAFLLHPALPALADELEIVTPPELPNAMTGEWYSEYLEASGGVEPYTWSVGDDWPWNVADSGYVTWYADWGYGNPSIQFSADDDQAGTYSFPVKVTDAEGTVAEKTFTVVVEENPNHAPVFTCLTPAASTVYAGPGETVDFLAVAEDPDGDSIEQRWWWYVVDENWNWNWQENFYGDSFSIEDISVPGQFHRVEVYASDWGRSASMTWDVYVGDFLVVSDDSLPDGAIGMPYEFALSARRTMGETGTVSWSAYGLPDGMSCDPATGVVSGTPESAGDYSVEVYAYDADSGMWSNYKPLPFHVDSGAPRIVTAFPEEGGVNLAGVSSQEFLVSAASSIGAALSYEWTLDGETVGTDATFAYERDQDDLALHSLRCEVFADGFDDPVAAEWTLGVLEATDPADATVVAGGTARLAVSVASSAEAQIVWHREGVDSVVGRGPVLTLAGVTASASYHAVVSSVFGEVTTASATVTVEAKPAGDCDLVVERIAAAAPGRYVPVIAARGTDVVWSEHAYRDWGDSEDALREWNAGYLGYVVAPEEQFASSGNYAAGCSNFRPVLTADGLYYVAGAAGDGTTYWGGAEEFRYRPVGGETMVVEASNIGTYAGENWSLRAMASGRVVVPKELWGWSRFDYSELCEVTGGNISSIAQVQAVSFDSEWGTTYAYPHFEFLPNAVGWTTGETLDAETGEWSSTGLAVLRDDDAAPLEVSDVPNAWWSDANADALLWTASGQGGGFDLVLADGTGANRTQLSSAAQFGVSGLVGWAAFWEECENGMATLEFRDASGNVNALDQKTVGDGGEGWSFRPVPYRGGVAWLHDTGAGTDANGGLEVRVWNGAETFVAATAVAQPSVVSLGNGGPDGYLDEETDKYVISGWRADGSLSAPTSVFARDTTTETRLVYERLVDGQRSLCVWEGDAQGQSAAVIATGYAPEPFIALSVDDTAVAAALNYGTDDAPEYRVFAAYDPASAPEISDLPGGMEMVSYECDVAAALGVENAEWSLYLGDGDFELSSEGVLSGKTAIAGNRVFRVLRRDADGTETISGVRVAIAENPDRPPVVDSATPEPGYVNFGSGTALAFSVTAHDPEGDALSYRWFVDGEEMEATGASFQLERELGDVSAHNVRCEIADATWNEGNVAVEWNAGVLAVVSAEGTPIHAGGTSWLSVTLEASAGFYTSGGETDGWDTTTWYDAESGEKIGNGNSVKAPATGSGSYYAVVTTDYGTVQTDVVTVEVDPAPAVGRIYKRSGGPAVVGNRCVLHAAALGEQPLEAVWTRDGEEVGTGDTLDVAALSKDDFGSYVLTVRNACGSVSSDPFVLSPAPSGTVVGWAQDGSEESAPRDRIDGVVQIAASSFGGVALKLDGTVAAWSDNAGENGLADVPAGLSGVAQVAAARDWNSGTAVAAALKRDGSIVVWGNASDWFPTQIPDLGDVVQIALGSGELVALRADGTVARVYSEWSNSGLERACSEICEAADAVGVFAQNSDHAVLHDDGTLSDDFNAGGYTELLSVGGELYDWGRWITLGADGRARSNWNGDWDDSAAEALEDVVAVDAQYSYGRAALLTADGQVHLVTWDGDETPDDGAYAFAVSSGAAHTLAIVSDPDVDPEDSEMLAFLDEHGVVPGAASAPAIDVLRAAGADADGDGQTAWAEYVAGTDPSDEAKKFRADIVFENGVPQVRCDPDLGDAREYVIESASGLGGEWTATDNGEIAADADAPAKFFRVKVSLPSGD